MGDWPCTAKLIPNWIPWKLYWELSVLLPRQNWLRTRHKESTGEYVDDSVITAKVKAQIFDDPMLKVLQINVETFKGEVQLSGFVNSAAVSARAAEVTRSLNKNIYITYKL